MDNVFFNYIDWTLEENPRPFYVGKGKIKRVQQRERNAYWKNIAAKHGWRREVVYVTKDEAHAFEEEKRRILEQGTFEDGTPGRWGANLSEGGEGPSGRTGVLSSFFGRKHTPETRLKMSGVNHSHRGKRGEAHPNFGKVRTPETLAKLSGENNHGYGKKQPLSTRLKKGGENHPRASLTWNDVDAIRTRYAAGGITYKELAYEYGVKIAAIQFVVTYRTWRVRPSI